MDAVGGNQPNGSVESADQSVTAVVFDCDGILANTAPCWEEAFRQGAREFDLTLDRHRLAELQGAALTTGAQRLVEWSRSSITLADVIDVVHAKLVRAIDESELKPIDGVLDLLAELRSGVHLAVASNSPRSVLDGVLARLELDRYFAAAISADDVDRPKPAPDPYLVACAALGVDPGSSVAVEDSDIGTQSALAAGLTVINLTPSITPRLDDGPAGNGVLRVTSLADHRIRSLVLGEPAAGYPSPRVGLGSP